MAERKVSVEVEIADSNKTGGAAKEIERAAERIEKAADKAGDAMGGMGKAAAGSQGGIASLIEQIARTKGAAAAGLTPQLLGTMPTSVITDMARQMGIAITAAITAAPIGSGFKNPWTTAVPPPIIPAGGFSSGAGSWTSALGGKGIPTATLIGVQSPVIATGVALGLQRAKSVFSSAWTQAMHGSYYGQGPPRPGQTYGGAAAPAFGPAMKQSYDDLTKSLRDVRFGLLAASAAAAGFVAAGAPMTWQTFTGSVTLLGDQFAQLLIPAFMTASLRIQQMATWVEGLDAGTKSLISTTATWGGGILLTSAVLTGLGSILIPTIRGFYALGVAVLATGAKILTYNTWSTVLSPITGTVGILSGGFVGLGTAIRSAAASSLAFAMSPLGITLLATAGIVAYLTNGFGLLGNAIDDASNRSQRNIDITNRLRAGGSLVRQDYMTLPSEVRVAIEGARPRAGETQEQARARVLDASIREREAESRRILATNPSLIQARVEEDLNRPVLGGLVGGRIAQSVQRTRVADTLVQLGLTRQEAGTRVQDIPMAWFSNTREDNQKIAAFIARIPNLTTAMSETEIMKAIRQSGVPGMFEGLKTSIPVQPQMFQSGADAYYQVLQEVLARGPIEQEHLRNIMVNTELMVQALSTQNARPFVGPPAPGVQPP